MRDLFGDRVEIIAIPDFWAKENRAWHSGEGYISRIEAYARKGARIAKFWSAPRARDFERETGSPGLVRLDSPVRLAALETATSLGMALMTHIGDPDTWFRTKYADATVYGTKAEQYEPLEQALDRFPAKWIAAHMGGWPEDLEFLDGLLSRHANLHLDTSATKWMVREMSRHARQDVVGFLTKWNGRVLFGSDIVTSDDHLAAAAGQNEMQAKANGPEEAFDLYASRYFALRTMFETDYEGESPISDPDLAMVDPQHHDAMSAPRLRGLGLPPDLLRTLYRDAAQRLLSG
jgi:hypothetical protein